MVRQFWFPSSKVKRILLGRYIYFVMLTFSLSVFMNFVFSIGDCQIPIFIFHIVLQITIDPLQGKKVDHNGVKIELLGQIGVHFCCFRIMIIFLYLSIYTFITSASFSLQNQIIPFYLLALKLFLLALYLCVCTYVIEDVATFPRVILFYYLILTITLCYHPIQQPCLH